MHFFPALGNATIRLLMLSLIPFNSAIVYL